MIHFDKTDAPKYFGRDCKEPGLKWLDDNPDYKRLEKRLPYRLWTKFNPDLREAFSELCAYGAMYIMSGQVDHFRPVAVLQREGNDHRIFEWDNFRYCDGPTNGSKSTHIILDPFVVQDGWFEILLPSLQLVVTDAIPEPYRELALFTIKQLKLRDGERIVSVRRGWFQKYQEGKLPLNGLRYYAPLIAAAVQKDLDAGTDWRYRCLANLY